MSLQPPEPAGDRSAGLLGLDADETALLADLLTGAAAALGIDGARVVAGLARGRPLGEALDLPPGLADLLYAKAHLRFAAGRHAEAGALFRALCVLDGRSADHWLGYGICLRRTGAEAEADLAVATAVALRPDWVVARFHAASLAAARADWPAVATHLDAFERGRDPDLPAAMLRDAARLRLALARRQRAG